MTTGKPASAHSLAGFSLGVVVGEARTCLAYQANHFGTDHR
jgi:hypothetical protein